MGKKDSVIKYKALYAFIMILVYLVGRCIPLYCVDTSAYTTATMDAQNLIMQSIGGDMNSMSIFALGISPYMMANIIVQIISVCRSSDTKAKSSPKKMNLISLTLTFIFALGQAVMRANQLHFIEGTRYIPVVKVVTVVEMIAGVMLILWICERNKKYGIGGQTTFIFINILSGVLTTLNQYEFARLCVPLIISAIVMVVVLVMENAEKQIPVQRISIHNIYADKNYLGIKLNPIGIMPVMFSAGFFLIPQLIVNAIRGILPYNTEVIWLQQNMVLTKPLGIIVYIVVLYVLTIGFSFVFVSPKDITEQFLKSGDSLVDFHAGKETKRYLSQEIRRISFVSATVMSICLGVPMLLQLWGNIDSSLVMFPSSIMMLTGIWCNLYQEMIAIKNYDAYKPFI